MFEIDFLIPFLLSFLAPVHSTTPLSKGHVQNNSTSIWWLVDSLKYVPVHFYVMGGGALLIVVIGGPIVIVYWYCCRGKEAAEAEQARRNANRATVCGQGNSLSTSGPATLQLTPPSYNDVTSNAPPSYMEISTIQTPTLERELPRETIERSDPPPDYTMPQITSIQPHEVDPPTEDPPAYSDSPTLLSRLPPVV